MIMDMLEQDGQTEIQRNELAEKLGCVPSQINYVISSRFTPEQGYIVESRRGGGGFIRITRANYNSNEVLMHLINNIGNELDEGTGRAHIYNLNYQEILSSQQAKLILSAINESCFKQLPSEYRDKVRAAIFKQMILSIM